MDRLRVVAEEAALAVGELLCRGFARPGAVETKEDFHDVVTRYDRVAEERIASHLMRSVPGSRIHGEEGGVRGEGAIEWYVDPIDGTNNFATQVPFFCVSIAAVQDGGLVAGVVYDPLRQELFAADLDGAHCNGKPVMSYGASSDETACLETALPRGGGPASRLNGKPDANVLAELIERFRTVRRLGSGVLSLAYVAAGRIDVTLGVGANPWDVAAGAMLVRAAGGKFLPLPVGMHSSSPWKAETYLAYVGNFDLDESCLSELAVTDGEVISE